MTKVPYTMSEESITCIWDGKPYSVRKDNANFALLRQALFDADYDKVGEYLDIKKSVEDFVDGEVEVKDEQVYYHGNRVHGVVVDKLLEMLRAGLKDSAPFTNYIKRLMLNPSSNSVEELFTFLGYKQLPITPEGKVLGYKGVQKDFYSSTGNADTIVVQGTTNERHQIFNGVGETIEVQRRCVDDNKDHHCSHGLHIGSYDYAEGWAGSNGKLLLVEFDPEDAVSVPTDCNYQKLRVSKYKVVADITDTRQELNKAVYNYNQPIYGSSDEDEYCEEDCECDTYEVDDADYDNLAIRNYVENKHEKGEYPNLKQIQSRMKGSSLTCADIQFIVEELGYYVEGDEDSALSQWKVYPN
ncbi:MAG: hypothetical protein CL512_05570 [Actinobacteria bacterium]|nr:hypothetical protein [Actinomycetota bacterium]|tara:strand:- start:1036 stop:2103 length:1068 start_codon:yes stop_codon:yes gene_type:complete